MDLVILAAGIGSRFGGLKQVEPIDDQNRFIIDYSIRDAVAAGFDHIVLIVRHRDLELFKDTIGSRIPKGVVVDYVFQEMDSIPDSRIPEDRTKPLGTAHAILCCRDVVKDPFLVINADDFYGAGSYRLAVDFDCKDDVFGCITYKAGNTLTAHGSVKRGVCTVEGDLITGITESTIHEDGGMIHATPLDGSGDFITGLDSPVSMNMFILPPCVLEEFGRRFDTFLDNMRDPLKSEFLLPDVIDGMVKEGMGTLRNIVSDERWYGVTYREDLDEVKEAVRRLNGSVN